MDGQGNLSLITENITICEGISRAVDLPHGDYVLISIEDTGRGILPDHLSRIFEPFFTTKELTGGTGLGLSMTHGFVRQSGGDLVVASELGRGTTFSLYLPRAESDDVILKSRAEKLAPTASSHLKRDVSKIVILVVEDEPALLSLICTALERRGFSTLRSADPQQAMRLIKENDAIDLVLSDIMMRGSDSGFEMASRIRQSRPKLPFIFMSGYADAAAPNGHQELGTFDVLSKPFDIQTLVDAVEKTLAAV
jgi:two-component system cell cycle sensor histidine kinase/response regulator CckA